MTCDGVWLGNEARETPADGVSLAARLTGGARPTGTGLTRVWSLHTPLAPADLPVVTVRVHHALRTTASDGVGLGDETWQAPTDGVALTVGGAGGPGATGARLAGVQNGASDLRAGVGGEAWGTLAEGPALLGDTHRVLATGVGLAGVGHHTALLRGWVWHQAFGALAGRLSFLGNTHGAGTTGVRVAGVAPRCGLVVGQWRLSGLVQAGVGAAVEAAETPVRAVQVCHSY